MSDAAPSPEPALKFKAPATLGAAADRLYTVRAKRLALQKQVDAMRAEETFLSEHLIQKLPKSQASGIAGRVARATVGTKDVPQVADWEALQAHILKNAKRNPGVWALMQRRVGEAAVKELWEAGKTVPGVTKFEAVVVRLNKL